MVILFGKGNPVRFGAFAAAMQGNDDDVMALDQCRNVHSGPLDVGPQR